MIYDIPKPVDGIIVIINQWSIREVIYGDNKQRTHHLVGYIPDEGAGRVTSAIQSFNKKIKSLQRDQGGVINFMEQQVRMMMPNTSGKVG